MERIKAFEGFRWEEGLPPLPTHATDAPAQLEKEALYDTLCYASWLPKRDH